MSSAERRFSELPKIGGEGRGKLYVVATPIGNLGDISLRALDTLRAVDTVFAEDTRTTERLLAHHGIAARLVALHEHNEHTAARAMCRLLSAGRDVALVTDAGTPGISDPGALAVREARAAGSDVVPIPGPNAAIAALSVAGFAGPFAFLGFLPPRRAARRKALEAWREFPHTLVLYEAPHRILECVDDLTAALGPSRAIVLARELTKIFEDVHVCSLGEARTWLEEDSNRRRGEFVLLVSGASAAKEKLAAESERVLGLLLAELPLKTAVRLAAEISGAARNALYARALKLDKQSRR
jgi:16S rRNA (cytidine1402-2'-O)-methyltransferase